MNWYKTIEEYIEMKNQGGRGENKIENFSTISIYDILALSNIVQNSDMEHNNQIQNFCKDFLSWSAQMGWNQWHILSEWLPHWKKNEVKNTINGSQ